MSSPLNADNNSSLLNADNADNTSSPLNANTKKTIVTSKCT